MEGLSTTPDGRERRLTIRLPERLWAGLQQRAQRDRRSVNSYVLVLFERHLAAETAEAGGAAR